MNLTENLKDNILFVANTLLALFIINIISTNFIKMSLELSFISSLYLLIILFFINFPFKKFSKIITNFSKSNVNYNQFCLGIISVILSFVFFILTKKQIMWLASTTLFISGLYIILYSFKIKRKEFVFLSLTSFVYSLFFLFTQTIPAIWLSMQRFSLFFSSFSASLVEETIIFGQTISGIWITVIFVILLICIFLVSNNKNKIDLILNIIGVCLCWIIYLILVSTIGFENKIKADDFSILLFILCLLPALYYLKQCKFKYTRVEFKKTKLKKIFKNSSFLAFISIILSILFLTTFYPLGNDIEEESPQVLFYNKNQLVDWNTPKYSPSFQNIKTGMIGLLPSYLDTLGYTCNMLVENKTSFFEDLYEYNSNGIYLFNLSRYISVFESETITAQTLENINVFVVVNLQESFEPEEKNVIWNFVKEGGSLLVIGDHTDVGDIKEPLNEFLSPVDITYRFDSSIPLNLDENNWSYCYQLMHHPICKDVEKEYGLQINIGASLNISLSSFPIIIGKYALSDKGNYFNSNMGNIGNYEYERDEQIGDIILAASTYYGQGKVVVFGDTTSFINSKSPYTNQLISNTFNWLKSKDTVVTQNMKIVLSSVFLLLAFVIIVKFRKKFLSFHFLTLGVCIALLISVSINSPAALKPVSESTTAFLDTSHLERFNIKTSTDNSIDEMMYHISANGYLPYLKNNFLENNVGNKSIMIFNAPTKSFTEEEVDLLKEYISKGNLVILATGYEDKTASIPLLSEFNLDIENIPLGKVNYNLGFLDIKFVDAWPINILDYNNTEVFYNYKNEGLGYNYSTIVFKKYGDGGLLLISDSKFLLNKNLKWPGNSRFMAIIFDALYERGVLK